MAQLSDDCFAFGGQLLSVDEGVRLIVERVQGVPQIERAPLRAADNRILAADVVAAIPLPPFANSAVDGYAVRHADLTPDGPTVLPVRGRFEAGARPGELDAGAAARIFTGAAMPAGADTVFMQEDVTAAGDGAVSLPAGLRRGANMRPAGEDVAAGAPALPRGRRLRPQDVALAAALGRAELEVARRLRVGVFSTGDELASPGEALDGARIYDSNRYMLLALLERLGCEAVDLGVLRDRPDDLARALRAAAAEHDLIVTSGGVS
ncbi:MAG TPA: molybdopterin molybdotransferase MoeA, partial [Beijerinckiaceae bacterium]